jgi:hypothetical protein
VEQHLVEQPDEHRVLAEHVARQHAHGQHANPSRDGLGDLAGDDAARQKHLPAVPVGSRDLADRRSQRLGRRIIGLPQQFRGGQAACRMLAVGVEQLDRVAA